MCICPFFESCFSFEIISKQQEKHGRKLTSYFCFDEAMNGYHLYNCFFFQLTFPCTTNSSEAVENLIAFICVIFKIIIRLETLFQDNQGKN